MPTVTPMDLSFGAVITDVKLGAMNDDEWKVVEDAFHEYAALVFPGQHLTNEDHVAFGKRFGGIEILRNDGNEYAMITNKAADGKILSAEEKRFQTLRGNCLLYTSPSPRD